MMLNKPVAGERLTAVFSCFVSCHNEILQNSWGKKWHKWNQTDIETKSGKALDFYHKELFFFLSEIM